MCAVTQGRRVVVEHARCAHPSQPLSALTPSYSLTHSRTHSLSCYLSLCRDLASEDAARVFVTDTILTTIMCAAKSVYSWDIVVTKVGDKLFFDKREGSTLDLLTVNETAPEQVR